MGAKEALWVQWTTNLCDGPLRHRNILGKRKEKKKIVLAFSNNVAVCVLNHARFFCDLIKSGGSDLNPAHNATSATYSISLGSLTGHISCVLPQKSAIARHSQCWKTPTPATLLINTGLGHLHVRVSTYNIF